MDGLERTQKCGRIFTEIVLLPRAGIKASLCLVMYAMVGVTITKVLDAQLISAHLHLEACKSILYSTHTCVQQHPAKQQYSYHSTG